MKYSVNVSSQPNHPTANILQDSWQDHYGTYKPARVPLSHTVKQALETLSIHLDPPAPPPTPWISNHCNVDLSLTSVIDKKTDSPVLQRALALEFIDSNSHLFPVHTDGSKATDGHASAAFSAPNYKKHVRIADGSTVYTAEMIAIKEALNYLTEIKQNNCIIFSDSLSVLQTLKLGTPGSSPVLADEVRKLARQIPDVQFAWVPSHVGVSGNESADSEAKLGLENTNVDFNNVLCINDAYNKIERYMTGEWQKAWSANPTGEFCRNIQPIVSGNIQYISKTREKEVIITRLRLGHCHLNYYLHKIDCHDTGLCDSCHVPQTLEHHFLFCDAQIHLITKLKAACSSLNKPFNISSFLNESKCIDLIYDQLSADHVFL